MSPRLAAIQGRMAEERIDLLALAPGAHMEWTIGFSPHADERACLLCITPRDAAFLMPALNAAEMRAHTNLPFVEWADADGPEAAFAQL